MHQNNYVDINLEDVMRALSECNDPIIKQELCGIYTNEDYNELGRKRISKNNKIYSIIKKFKEEQKSFITIEDLSLALTRSTYEYNHSVRKKLTKYIHQFLDNISTHQDNELLIYQIINDKEIFNYIKKTNSFEDYEVYLSGKGEEKTNNIENEIEEEKRISYVMMS